MIDLLSPLKNLQKLAIESKAKGEFREGYLMAIRHAIELAEVQQKRIARVTAMFDAAELGKIQQEMKHAADSAL